MDTGAKEFCWAAKLTDKNKVINWSGKKDGTLEQVVLKVAVLGPGAAKNERSVVEVTTFDSDQKKIKSCICSLSLGVTENMNLADLSLFPPVNFTLVEGSGPVHITGSHMVLDDDDLSDDDDMSEFEEEDLEAMKGIKNKKPSAKVDTPGKSKKPAVQIEDEDDDDYEDLDDDSEEDDEPNLKRKNESGSFLDNEADEDDDMEDDSEVEEMEEKAPPKKIKLANGQAAAKGKKNGAGKMATPSKGAKSAPEVQKTPNSQNKENAQTPKSAKKTPSKPKCNSVEEVKAAISKFPGGKPRKQDKFINWVQNHFKVTEDSWKTDLWNWHKKQLGL